MEATSGSVLIVPLDIFDDSVTISTSAIGQGNFAVVLVVDGIYQDQLNLLVL